MWNGLTNLLAKTQKTAHLGFNKESLTISLPPSDQVTCYRNKKSMEIVLEQRLLLENKKDFATKIITCDDIHTVHCQFLSSFGQYAFWRLASNQCSDIISDFFHPRPSTYTQRFTSKAIIPLAKVIHK